MGKTGFQFSAAAGSAWVLFFARPSRRSDVGMVLMPEDIATRSANGRI